MHLFVIAIFFLYILISAGFAFLTCFLFVYDESAMHGRTAFCKKHHGGPWRTLLRIIPKAFLSQLIIFPTYFLGMLSIMRHPIRPGADDPAPAAPILLVHGLYHTPAAWLLFLWRVRKTRWNNVYTLRYSSSRNDLASLRELLIQRILQVSSESGESKIFVVGHSLGGLLARSIAGDPCCRERLAGVVTLGAPHGGSKLAALGFGALAQSIHPESDELSRLLAFDAPPEAPCLSVYSPVDNMVLPNENLRLDLPGWQEQETPPMSHVFMLYSRDVHNRVLSFLEHVPFSGTKTS